jgi:hypothetical protein
LWNGEIESGDGLRGESKAGFRNPQKYKFALIFDGDVSSICGFADNFSARRYIKYLRTIFPHGGCTKYLRICGQFFLTEMYKVPLPMSSFGGF